MHLKSVLDGIFQKSETNLGSHTGSKLKRALIAALTKRHEEIFSIVKKKKGITLKDISSYTVYDHIAILQILNHLQLAGLIYSEIIGTRELWYPVEVS